MLGAPEVIPRPEGAQGTGGGNISWLCRCDCGEELRVRGHSLKYETNPKCRKCAFAPAPDWAERFLYVRYRHGAQSRNLEFRLTFEEFGPLIHMPCHYCGRKGVGTLKHPSNEEVSMPFNGVDRLNPGNYEPGNVAPCCFRCNKIKSDMPLAEFVAFCKLVSQRLASD